MRNVLRQVAFFKRITCQIVQLFVPEIRPVNVFQVLAHQL